jgi:hypothetical protein
MSSAEAQHDSIFCIPQRLKNAISILVATTTAAGCAPKPTQPSIGSTELPGSPTPTHVETIPPTGTPSPTEFGPTSTETPVPTEVHVPRQVELVFAPDDVTVPDSCKVVPEATADNSLTLNGQPLPDGTVIDSFQSLTGGTHGDYRQPILLIAARAVAIEKLIPDPGMGWKDPYLLCYNVTLPSGDNIVLASLFENSIQPGFETTELYTLPGTDVAGVMLDQIAEHPTPYVVMRNSDFIGLFTSGKIIGQQVLLTFPYDYADYMSAAGENPARAAIVAALKAGRLPSPVHFNPRYFNQIGARLVVPAKLVP